jgi:hypothetical protein
LITRPQRRVHQNARKNPGNRRKEIHPSGSEPSTKLPANSLGKRKKGQSVAPLVAPSASDLTPLHAIELFERFYQLDDSGRAGLLKFARELGRKSKCK